MACMGDRRGAYRRWGDPRKGDHLLTLSPTRSRENNIKMGLQEVDGEPWTRLIWIRTGTCDGGL